MIYDEDFGEMIETVRLLNYDEEPDYAELKENLLALAKKEKINLSPCCQDCRASCYSVASSVSFSSPSGLLLSRAAGRPEEEVC